MNAKARWYEALCRAYGVNPGDLQWVTWAQSEWGSYCGCTFTGFRRAFEKRLEAEQMRGQILARYPGRV